MQYFCECFINHVHILRKMYVSWQENTKLEKENIELVKKLKQIEMETEKTKELQHNVIDLELENRYSNVLIFVFLCKKTSIHFWNCNFIFFASALIYVWF